MDSKDSQFQLTSPAFRDGGNIPAPYMHDPDSVRGDFVHWLMWDIPARIQSINANSVPVGAIQGLNGAPKSGYTGPCPPAGTGTHRYIFELYALDKSPTNLDNQTTREQLQKAIDGHVIAKTALTGLFSADQIAL